MANSSNISLRGPDGLDRPLVYEEVDQNFRELIDLIDSYNSFYIDEYLVFVDDQTATNADFEQRITTNATNHQLHLDSTTAHDSASIVFDPTGTDLAATNVYDVTIEQNAWITSISDAFDNHLTVAAAHESTNIAHDGTGTRLTSTDVSAALAELDGVDEAGEQALTAHVNSTTAHQALHISYDSQYASIVSDNVHSALNELDSLAATASIGLQDHVQATNAHEAAKLSYHTENANRTR